MLLLCLLLFQALLGLLLGLLKMLWQIDRPSHGPSRSHRGILCWSYLAHPIRYTHLHPAILLGHHSLTCRYRLLTLVLHHLLLL